MATMLDWPHVGRSRQGDESIGRAADPLKLIIVIALVAVVTALFTALVFLFRDRGRGQRVVAALAVRVALSAALIAFLVLSYRMGWIAPAGVR